MNKRLVPRLRFKQFHKQWQHTKMNDIAKVVGGGTPSTKKSEYWNGNINWYSPDEISKSEKSYTYESKHKITQKGLKNSSAKLHPANSTILFTSRANIGAMSILKKEATTNQGFQSLELNNNIYPYFLYSDKRILKHKAFRVAHGSTFLEISNKELKNININIPTLYEQQKIGTFFAKLDRMIELQTKKLAHLKKLKRGYLQKIFPQQGDNMPQLRFNGFHDEWHEKKLNELGTTFTGLSGKTKKDFGHGKASYITYMDIHDHPIASKNNLDKIEIDNKQKKVKKGDVLFTTSSETPEEAGLSSVWIYDNDNIYLNSFSFGYRFYYNFDSYYVGYALRSTNMRRKMYPLAQGISRFNISKNRVIQLKFKYPSIQEQNKIGRFFKHLDKFIAQQGNKLTQLKQLKKAYLQKMFC